MNEISRRILCVDDEPQVLEGLRRLLRGKFEVTTAVGPAAGMTAVREQGPFAAVFSDFMMPGMNGIEFLKEVALIEPLTVRIMLTGCGELEVAVAALNEGHVWRFLNKPCSREVLVRTIQDALEQYRLVVSEQRLTAELNRANEALGALNKDLEMRVECRTAEIRALYAFVAQLNGLSKLQEVVDYVVANTAEMLRCRRVSLMLPDGSGEYLTIAAASGLPEDVRRQARVPIGSPVAGLAYREPRTIVVNESPRGETKGDRYESEIFAVVPMICTSLSTPGGTIGVLNATERTDGTIFSDEDLATFKAIADASAIAIQNQIRLAERNEARDAVILAMAKLAESRDPDTGAHLERVQVYCRLLCEALRRKDKYASVIDSDFVENVVRSSPLHDIGKVGIPDGILLKPGKLTADEFAVMKRHSTIGGDTIRALLKRQPRHGFLSMGMDIAYYHHEKFDGSGYPAGLSAETIPLPARIVALADVYDAMTSKRIYKAAMSHAEAAAFIRDRCGEHFDPDIVTAFEARRAEFEETAIELRDPDVSNPPIVESAECLATAVVRPMVGGIH